MVWRTVSSTQFALVIILLIACVGLTGVVLPQVPQDIASDPASYAWWLQYVAGPELGALAQPLGFFGLLDVFHSPVMTLLTVLLVTSILACTVRRWRAIRAQVGAQSVVHPADFYMGEQAVTVDSGRTMDLVADSVRRVVASRHYRLDETSRAGHIYAGADRYRYSGLGTLVSHLGLVVLLAGVAVGARYGFRVDSFVVTEGMTRDVGYGTGLSLELLTFDDEYWQDGTPRDFRSDVVVYGPEGSQTGVIRVNHPLDYAGIRFYQSFFGPAARLSVSDQAGDILYDGTLPLVGMVGQGPARPSGLIQLPSSDIAIGVIGPAAEGDDVLTDEQLGIQPYVASTGAPLERYVLNAGTAVTIATLTIRYDAPAQFSGFEVRHDPGVSLVWLGCAMLVTGMGATLYLPRRQFFVLLEPHGTGTRVFLRKGPGTSPTTQGEFQRMSEMLSAAISGTSNTGGRR